MVGALLPACLALLTALSAALEQRRTESVAEVARLVEQSRWAAAAAGQQLWASQRQLGLAMHGRVQAGLTATAMVLRAWVRSGPQREPEDRLRARVEATLDECLQAVEDPTTAPLGELLADLADVWAGVLDIDFDCDANALARLDDDPAAAAAAGEILRELLLNAVHHGRAGNAQVRLRLHSRNVLELLVRTPQAPTDAPGSPPGLGTELLASLSLGSQVDVGPTTRTTTVLLAVGD